MTYEEICTYLYDVPKFTKKNDFTHTRELLSRLGNPHRRFEVIHVAGSNGKGSVCAFISQTLCDAGLATGLFTSPHLVCMEERFRINGRNCTREDFTEAFEQVKTAVGEMEREGLPHPSFFEYLFVMGMLIFAKYKVKYLVLETGLGGRLDTTNLFEEPLMTVITSISLEHTDILGDTIEKIAWEKAGIIKPGVPVVFDGSDSRAAGVIRAVAREKRAPFYEVSLKNIKIQRRNGKSIDFCYSSGYDEVSLTVPFVAEYQMINAALAYQALLLLSTELAVYPVQIRDGIAVTKWQGRMQQVKEGIYFDGAHNAQGIRQFVRTVQAVGGARPLLLYSMVSGKDYRTSIRTLAQEVCWDKVIVTRIPDVRGLSEELLAEEFRKNGCETVVISDCREAYEYAAGERGQEQTLFCAGSLYLIGELEKYGNCETTEHR